MLTSNQIENSLFYSGGYIPFKHFLKHQSVNHSQKQWANGAVHTNTIESFWAIPTHQGSLKIGDKIIPCAVLPDKTRVLSERAIAAALGLKRGGSHWIRKKGNEAGADLPVYLSSPWLQPFISEDLKAALNDRRKYLGFVREGKGAYFKTD